MASSSCEVIGARDFIKKSTDLDRDLLSRFEFKTENRCGGEKGKLSTRNVIYSVDSFIGPDHGHQMPSKSYVPLRLRQLPASFWQEPKATEKLKKKTSDAGDKKCTNLETSVSPAPSTSKEQRSDKKTSPDTTSEDPCPCCQCESCKRVLSDNIYRMFYPCCFPGADSGHGVHAALDAMPLYARHLTYPTVWENITYTQYQVLNHQQLWRPIPTKSFSYYPHRFNPLH